MDLDFEIKTGIPILVKAAEACIYTPEFLIISSWLYVLAKFTFPTMVSYSALGMYLYFFYTKLLLNSKGKNILVYEKMTIYLSRELRP